MFATVVMCAAPSRGYIVEELAELTDRRKHNMSRAMQKLMAADVAVHDGDRYRLSDDFLEQWERELKESGITYSERRQKRRHEAERAERDESLRARTIRRSDPPLKGPEEMGRILDEQRSKAYEHDVEEQREKAGMTAAVFLHDQMREVSRMSWRELRSRWIRRGARNLDLETLRQAVIEGPYQFVREGAYRGEIYVCALNSDENLIASGFPSEEALREWEDVVRHGMRSDIARDAVLKKWERRL